MIPRRPSATGLTPARAGLVAFFALAASLAQATCANPAGAERSLVYNGDHHTYQFCNGTNWVSLGPPTTSGARST